jgi:hypothetical protein
MAQPSGLAAKYAVWTFWFHETRVVAGPLRNQAKLPACFLRGLREPRETAPGFPSAGVSLAQRF